MVSVVYRPSWIRDRRSSPPNTMRPAKPGLRQTGIIPAENRPCAPKPESMPATSAREAGFLCRFEGPAVWRSIVQIRANGAQLRWRLAHLLSHQSDQIGSCERQPHGKRFKQHYAQRINVAAMINIDPGELFRTHVGRTGAHRSGSGDPWRGL